MNYKSFFKDSSVAGESDILKSAFFADISHEVRTQLNGILGLAQLILKSKEIDSDIRNNVEMIVESGNSIHALFDNIMAYRHNENR